MKMLLTAACVAFAAGCATPARVPVTAYQRAQWRCEHAAFNGLNAPLLSVALYHDCMRAHGWSK